MVGLIGISSMLKGAKSGGHAARSRSGHVGSDEQAAHAILDQAGPNAAILLLRCEDLETRQKVVAQAVDRALSIWEGSREDFLAALDPGTAHDWVRTALGEPGSTDS